MSPVAFTQPETGKSETVATGDPLRWIKTFCRRCPDLKNLKISDCLRPRPSEVIMNNRQKADPFLGKATGGLGLAGVGIVTYRQRMVDDDSSVLLDQRTVLLADGYGER